MLWSHPHFPVNENINLQDGATSHIARITMNLLKDH